MKFPEQNRSNFPQNYCALDFFVNVIIIVLKYLNVATFTKDLLTLFILWIHPEFWCHYCGH